MPVDHKAHVVYTWQRRFFFLLFFFRNIIGRGRLILIDDVTVNIFAIHWFLFTYLAALKAFAAFWSEYIS